MPSIIKIIPPEGSDEKVCTSSGTRVIDVATGAEIPNVQAVQVSFECNDIIRATITLAATYEGGAAGTFLLPDDEGALKPVKSVEFTDGTTRRFD
jgi:hypothetical protein